MDLSRTGFFYELNCQVLSNKSPTSFLPNSHLARLLDPTQKRDGITVELRKEKMVFLDQKLRLVSNGFGKNLSGGEEVEENVEAALQTRIRQQVYKGGKGASEKLTTRTLVRSP